MSVRGIGKRFGKEHVLARVSFTAAPGEILGLIGPNGSGKTTLLECIAGLLPADSGEILWRGAALPRRQRKQHMFYVPDSIAPYADQPVRGVLEFFRDAFRESPGRLGSLVPTLGLEPVLEKMAGALSKGFRRRFLLAIGLLAPHPLLLMDEPFDGFDLRQARQIMDLLRDEAASGRSLVLSIHQLTDAQRICDRLVLLSAGRVKGEGTLTELAAAAATPGASLEEVFLALT
jgi:ABC-2 type transport system ATP-binding protein